MENLPERVLVDLPRLGRHWRADGDEAQLSQIRQQDADHAEWKVNVRRDIDHGSG
jgi:hypothetical protein